MSSLLVIFTVVFVLVIAASCGIGVLVMFRGMDAEEPPWRKRKTMPATGRHPVFKDVQ